MSSSKETKGHKAVPNGNKTYNLFKFLILSNGKPSENGYLSF